MNAPDRERGVMHVGALAWRILVKQGAVASDGTPSFRLLARLGHAIAACVYDADRPKRPK